VSGAVVRADPLRVAVVNLTSGGFSGGYSKYLREIAPRLRNDPRIASVTMVGPESVASQMDWHWPDDDARRGRRALRGYLERWRPDVVFTPTARSFRWRGAPMVTMVRNMESLAMPFSAPTPGERLRNVGRYLAAWSSVRRATRVIAVSDFVRTFLIDKWSVAPSSIGVVRHGVDIADPRAAVRPAALVSTPARMTIFAAGSIRPARGIDDVLEALVKLEERGTHGALWFGGAPTAGAEPYHDALRKRAEAAGVASQIQWLGTLSASEMQWCFTHADAFVMTSRVEACPNTVLEAMAAGARSISTRLAPMEEFYGDTASYYEAGSSHSLARALERVWGESRETGRWFRERSRQRACFFTWDGTVQRTISELQAAHASGG
jgi:glycosyltransferase involved in cell wall biosynthesis